MKLPATLREGRYVPFGPFLAGGGLAVMLVGPPACSAGSAGLIAGRSHGDSLRIGLTGGIGSGKSTVPRMLVALGAHAGRHRRHRARADRAGGAAMPALARPSAPTSSAPTARSTAQRMRELVFADAHAPSAGSKRSCTR